MINHFIVIKYKQGSPEQHIEEFCSRMLALKGEIEGVMELEVGRDILNEDRSWDIIISMKLASLEHLRAYQQHPAHLSAVTFNQPYVEEVASIDYELPFHTK